MSASLIVFADLGDVIGLLIGVIFVIIAVVGQILSKLREVQQPPRRQPGRPPQGVPPHGRQPQGRPPQAGPQPKPNPVEEEIRQFLRGAAERREAAAGRQAQRPRQAGPPPARPKPAAAPLAQAPVEAEIVKPELSQLREQLQHKKPGRLVSDLGTEVSLADEKMASHLEEVFDHQLGSLGRPAGGVEKPPAEPAGGTRRAGALALPLTSAAGMAAMLADRQNLRTAILVSEILRRPEER